jgi:hypothetical protein
MTLAPNGDILTANAGDGNIVETTPSGAQTDIGADTTGGAGALFGLTVPPGFDGIYFVEAFSEVGPAGSALRDSRRRGRPSGV